MRFLKTKTAQKPKFKFPTATVLLIAAISLIYVCLSDYMLYVSGPWLLKFGLYYGNFFIGAVSYMFMHISPAHLIGNMISLALIGIVAEQKLRIKDYFAIFFASGIVSGMVFFIMNPEVVIVGASSAIAGLMMAAYFVDIKKAIVASLAFVLISSVVTPAIISYTDSRIAELENKQSELLEQFNETKKAAENASAHNDMAAQQQYSQQLVVIITELNTTTKESSSIKSGSEREKKSQTSPLVHLSGVLVALAYMLRFRGDIVWQMPYQLGFLRKLLKKPRRKSKARK
ncbi:MAG: rhomboid family intramembrane serine protease [Candidatus Micrarchaeota archaeon]